MNLRIRVIFQRKNNMRTLVITIQTDSEETIEVLKRDLQQEIYCCTASFDVDNMIVEEKEERKPQWRRLYMM